MENYEPLDIIGSGSFGVIRKVRRKADGRILVRKEIDYRKMTEKEKRQLVSEVNILRELRHPNIVRYYERFVERERSMIYIIMEYCEGGDLATVIRQCKKENKRIPEDIVWNLLAQLLLALHECHHGSGPSTHPTVLHRDIKPDNVFLDGNQNVKLGDFGLSRVIENPESDFARTFVGTPFYMSPELVNESSYNTKSDVWALGCLVYELCALEPPFQAKTQAGLSAKIRQGRINQLPQAYSHELNAMVCAMLNTNQLKRPSTTEILKSGRIRATIKERELSLMHAELKKREEDLKRREALLDAREVSLVAREEAIARAEVLALGAEAPARHVSGLENMAPMKDALIVEVESVVHGRERRVLEDRHDFNNRFVGAVNLDQATKVTRESKRNSTFTVSNNVSPESRTLTPSVEQSVNNGAAAWGSLDGHAVSRHRDHDVSLKSHSAGKAIQPRYYSVVPNGTINAVKTPLKSRDTMRSRIGTFGSARFVSRSPTSPNLMHTSP